MGVAIEPVRVIDWRQRANELSLQREVDGSIHFMKLLVYEYMPIPGLDQFGVAVEPEIDGWRQIQKDHQANRGHYEPPTALQCEIDEEQGGSYLYGDCKRK